MMAIKNVEIQPEGQGSRIKLTLKSGYVVTRYVEDTNAERVQEIANQLIKEFRERINNR